MGSGQPGYDSRRNLERPAYLIPNDKMIITGRYGYIGNTFGLTPVGGNQIPMIYQYAISQYTNTGFFVSPIDRPAHDFNADMNYYKENWGVAITNSSSDLNTNPQRVSTFSSYGNGALHHRLLSNVASAGCWICTYFRCSESPTLPGWPCTSPIAPAFMQPIPIEEDRLTLNLGLRVDNQGGKNEAVKHPWSSRVRRLDRIARISGKRS